MKNKYDSSVVFLYLMGKEDLLPAHFRKQIPYSTISSWRKTDSTSYLGHEFRYYFTEANIGTVGTRTPQSILIVFFNLLFHLFTQANQI